MAIMMPTLRPSNLVCSDLMPRIKIKTTAGKTHNNPGFHSRLRRSRFIHQVLRQVLQAFWNDFNECTPAVVLAMAIVLLGLVVKACILHTVLMSPSSPRSSVIFRADVEEGKTTRWKNEKGPTEAQRRQKTRLLSSWLRALAIQGASRRQVCTREDRRSTAFARRMAMQRTTRPRRGRRGRWA